MFRKKKAVCVVLASLLLTSLWSVTLEPLPARAATSLTITASKTEVTFGTPVMIDKVETDDGVNKKDVTSSINGENWSCDPVGAATVTDDNPDVVSFQQAGTITLTAKYVDGSDEISGSVIFNVKPVITATVNTDIKIVGELFEYTFTASAGTSDWTVTDDHATAPITSIGTDGKLSVTLTKAHIGTHNLKVTASAGSVSSTEFPFTLIVNPRDPGEISLDKVTGTVGQAFNGQLSVPVDDAAVTWSYTGTLPDGLVLDGKTGKITGTPKKKETAVIRVKADNKSGNPSFKDIEITISDETKGVIIKDGSTTITTLTMNVGETKTITAEVDTTSADKSVKWDTTNKNTIGIANATGTTIEVTAKQAGTSALTATSQTDTAKVGSIAITVTDKPVAVTGITIAGLNKVNVGGTTTLTATVTPDTATDKTVKWSSSDETKATVDANGVVTGFAAGNVTITAEAKDGSGIEGTYPVTVVAAGAPVITTAKLDDGIVGNAYKLTLTATGTADIKWELTSGTLPAGLTFDKTTATISGTPTAATTSPVTLAFSATNAVGFDTKSFTLEVSAAALKDEAVIKPASGSSLTGAVDADKILDDFIVGKAEAGKEISYTFELTEVAPSGNDKTGIDNEVGKLFNGLKTSQYKLLNLDMSVVKRSKVISTNTSENPVNIPDLGVVVEIHLRVDSAVTKYLDRMQLIRSHSTSTGTGAQGVKVFERLTAQPAKANWKDGQFYASGNDLYIYTRYFSAYTVAYTTVDTARVTFNMKGGSAIDPVLVEKGTTLASLPSASRNPVRSGYTFDGWFTNDALTQEFDIATDTVSSDITLYAMWTAGTRSARSNAGTAERTASRNTSVRGSQTGDNPETEKLMHLITIMGAASFALLYISVLARRERRKARITRE